MVKNMSTVDGLRTIEHVTHKLEAGNKAYYNFRANWETKPSSKGNHWDKQG